MNNKQCPKCKKTKLKLIQDSRTYHLAGMSGGGLCFFRTVDLYKCDKCGQYFYSNNNRIMARPLDAEDV